MMVDWIIHCCVNGACCNECGGIENGYLPNLCNAHTHGMEHYHHQDFQLVLQLPVAEIMRILNTMGLRVQRGERFKAGDLVNGVYEDCDVRLDAVEENGRIVLRVVIPDKYNRFPEEPACMVPYKLQLLETEELYMKNVNHGRH